MCRLRVRFVCALLGAGVACAGSAGSPAARAAGWLSATTLAATANGPSGAVVALDPDGDAIAAWTDDDGAGTQSLLVTTRPAGGSWSAPDALASDGFVDAPAVTLDAAGNATVVWVESANGTDYTARAARRDALIGVWSAPHDFPASGPTAVIDPQTQVRADAAGDAIAAWLEHDSGAGTESVRAAVWSATAGAWDAPATLSDPSDASVAYGPPQIAPDASGGALVGWIAQRNADPSDYPVQTNALSGSAFALRPTDALAGDALPRSPLRLVGLSGGDVAASWFETGASTTTLVGALRSGGGWASAPVSSDVAPACVPLQALGADADDGATVVWQPQSSMGLDSVRLTSGGWGTRLPLFPDSPTSTETVSDAAVDHGIAVFVAHDPVGGTDSVLASRRQAGGTWSRPADLLDAAPAGTSLAGPDIAADAAGDALASWTATDGGGSRSVSAAAFVAGPRLSDLSVPASGTPGASLDVSVHASSAFATVAQTTWDFGDGSAPAVGASASHAYAQAGVYTVTVTATDSLGNTAQATRQVTIAAPSPGGGGGTPGGTKPPPKPAPLLRPRIGGLRHSVLVLGRGSRTLKLLVRNLNRVRLTGGVSLVRPRRGRVRALTLARIRSAAFPARRRATPTLRLSDAALRALRAASGFRLPVVLTLSFRAADGRRVTVTLRATLDASARFGAGARRHAPTAHAAC
ncbi:MAG TPA: PKD domain-containing protein [Conexibacter sp.]|nr:PKD domain-containing protein [Conexibacter sp.]